MMGRETAGLLFQAPDLGGSKYTPMQFKKLNHYRISVKNIENLTHYKSFLVYNFKII
jgi:hypothetical protein